MSENEHPEPVIRAPAPAVDKRSSSGHKADYTDSETYHRNRNRLANVRWKLGENPHDDLAVGSVGARELTPEQALQEPGYVDYKVEMHEPHQPTEQEQYAGLRGSDSGIRCWSCRGNTYRIVDERSSEQVASTQDDIVWAQKMNRPVDPERIPTVWLLFCPGCKHKMQMPDYEVRRLQDRAAMKEALG